MECLDIYGDVSYDLPQRIYTIGILNYHEECLVRPIFGNKLCTGLICHFKIMANELLCMFCLIMPIHTPKIKIFEDLTSKMNNYVNKTLKRHILA